MYQARPLSTPVSSAVMRAASEVPSPVNRPVSMSGSAEGTATRLMRKSSSAPSVRAMSMWSRRTERMPARVMVAMGNQAPKPTMKAAEAYVVGSSSSASGSSEAAGTGPTVWRSGWSQ